MNTTKISSVYAANASKNEGDTLTHTEWNDISSAVNVAQTKINSLVDDVAAGTGGSGSNSELSVEQDAVDVDKKQIKIQNVLVGELTAKGTKGTNVALSGDNNINIEPRPALGDGEGKNTAGLANRKGGNISLKPGDDIELCSHKRGTSKNTEVAVKVIDGSDNPVKLQVFAGDITLTTKGKNKTKKKDATTGEDTTELLYDDPNVMNVNITTGDGKGYLKVRAQAIDLRCEDHGGIALQPKGNDGEGHMNKIKFEHGGGDGLEFGTFNTEKTSIFTDEYRFNKNGVWKMATRVKETSDKYDGTDETTHYKYQKQSDDFYDFINNADATCTTEDIINTANCFNSNNVSVDGTLLKIYRNHSYSVLTVDQAIGYNLIPDLQTMISSDHVFINVSSTAVNNVSATDSVITSFQNFALGLGLQESDLHNLSDYYADRCVFAISSASSTDAVDNTNTKVIIVTKNYTAQCDIKDVITLVDYMKTNNQGPWAN